MDLRVEVCRRVNFGRQLLAHNQTEGAEQEFHSISVTVLDPLFLVKALVDE